MRVLRSSVRARCRRTLWIIVLVLMPVAWRTWRASVRSDMQSSRASADTGGMSGSAGTTAKGDLRPIGCAVAFAFYIVLLEPAARVHPSTPLVAAQLWMVALLALAALPFVPRYLNPTPAFWWAVLYTGVLSTAVCMLGQTWAQARTSAVRAALIFALEPVFAAVFSVALGRERLGIRELTGGTLIVLGIVAAELGGALWARRRAVAS